MHVVNRKYLEAFLAPNLACFQAFTAFAVSTLINSLVKYSPAHGVLANFAFSENLEVDARF